jgi:hypothetical protein
VVGEGTRCWFGNQFSLIAPRFAAYGVDLWVPELGGKFDARNPSHKMLMSVLGGMSESERQHVQARVRAAMDAQVVNEGRHQGGRAPMATSWPMVGCTRTPVRQPRATGCGYWHSMRLRPRSCVGSSPSIWTAKVTGQSPTA